MFNLVFALFFGLIHGLGFSGYFKMLIGSSNSKLIPLLEFALGIEFAQIIIVLIILILGFIFQTIFFKNNGKENLVMLREGFQKKNR